MASEQNQSNKSISLIKFWACVKSCGRWLWAKPGFRWFFVDWYGRGWLIFALFIIISLFFNVFDLLRWLFYLILSRDFKNPYFTLFDISKVLFGVFLLLYILIGFVFKLPNRVKINSDNSQTQEGEDNKKTLRDDIFKFLSVCFAVFAIVYFLYTYNTFESSRFKDLSDTYTNSVKDLASKESTETQRVAALLNLEKVATESPYKYSDTVLKVISAHIREQRNKKICDDNISEKKPMCEAEKQTISDDEGKNKFCSDYPLPSDIQTALDILASRSFTNGTLESMIDLSNTNLFCAKFGKGSTFYSRWNEFNYDHRDFKDESELVTETTYKRNLKFLDFSNSNLTGADFSYSHLYKSDFTDAILNRTKFYCTDLRGVNVTDNFKNRIGGEKQDKQDIEYIFDNNQDKINKCKNDLKPKKEKMNFLRYFFTF